MSEPKRLRMHLLVVDAAGPVASAPVGLLGVQLGTRNRYRAACDPAITMGPLDRGTTEPCQVWCKACRETDAFKQVDRPKPGSVPPP